MIGASKILTVSYGTFSCTLEGFDDPFNTMKAIAEYFRDLAAEDRYFGAEPPQPDAAMLHRIAEREIQRRVEARVQDNGVILRADVEAAPVARLAEPEPAPAPAPTVIPAQQAAAVTESVAAKLSKLRAAKTAPEPAVLDFPPAAEADEPEALLPDPGLAEFISPAVTEEPIVEAVAEVAVEPVAEVSVEPVAEAQPEPAVEAATEAGPAPEVVLAEAAEASVAEVAVDEIAVVEEAPVVQELEAVLPEGLADELDDDAARALSDALSGVMADNAPRAGHSIEDLFPEGDALPDDVDDILPESAPISAAEASEDVDLAALVSAYHPEAAELPEEAEVAVAAEEVVEIIDVEVIEAVAEDLDLETLIGSLAEETRLPETVAEETAEPVSALAEEIEDLAPMADDLAAAVDDDEPEAPAVAASRDAEAEEAEAVIEAAGKNDQPEVRPEATEKLQRARARVVRIRRADAELPPAATESEPAEVKPAAAETADEPRRKLEVESDDAALNRLIAQTNTEMEGPEAKRRLSAIAHLKAAVAATVADRLTRGKPAPTEAARAEPYRDDLARAVRPQRPEAPGVRGERPAPLVLVSEQRIDRPAPAAPAQPPAHVAPVRPRRVSSAALAVQTDDEDDEDEDGANIFADTRGFVEFAEKLGVRSLPDLMEAAAAYTASVEGRPHFSRPHLIKHLSAARGQEIPREDSLRTFGRLLREGRIEKVKRGQFAVNEGSRFLGEAKKING